MEQDQVEVAKIVKEARLEERKLIENGLECRQKAQFTHEKEMHKIRVADQPNR